MNSRTFTYIANIEIWVRACVRACVCVCGERNSHICLRTMLFEFHNAIYAHNFRNFGVS